MKKFFHVLMLALMYSLHVHAILVIGDPNAASGDTFSFDVVAAVFDPGAPDKSAPRLWIAAAQDPGNDVSRPFGLCFINQLQSYVGPNIVPMATPMTNPQDAVVATQTGATTVPNPMWGAAYQFLNVASQKPVFVLSTALSQLYAVYNLEHYANPTEKKPNITQLLLYDFGAGEQIKTISTVGETTYLAHAIGTFGADATSKISAVIQTKGGPSGLYLNLLADTIIQASTPALFDGSALTTLGSNVALDVAFSQLYVGIDATAAAASSANGIVIAQLATNGSGGYLFQFTPLAPTTVVNASTAFNTVISTQATSEIRIKNIVGLATSTGLSYVIVARDNGTDAQQIFAFPIVSQTTANNGLIADFTQINEQFTIKPNLYKSRNFSTVISDANQINISGAYATQLSVGGNLPIDAGNFINDLYAVGDSVYAVIGNQYTGTQAPGTYRSQAIFAADGHIIGWTAWARVLGTDKQQLYSILDRKTISGFYVADQNSALTPSFKAVYQTTFTPTPDFNDSSSLTPFFTQSARASGGTQGLFNIHKVNLDLNLTAALQSYMVATGYNSVVLYPFAQKATTTGIYQPIANPQDNMLTFDNINHTAIIACDVATDNTNFWLFVGGASGLSVLVDPATGVTFNNSSTENILQAVKLGDFSFVKKVAGDLMSGTAYIYVLTSTQLYRIAMDAGKFTNPTTVDLDPELLLDSSDLAQNSYFLDMVIDTGFCLIGTTNGLYSVDFSTNGSPQKIAIPDGNACASQLFTVSQGKTDNEKGFATLSNLYVLSNTFGTQQARLNRFTIENKIATPFNDFMTATITDNVTTGTPSSLIRFDNYISSFFVNGTWNLFNSYFTGPNQPRNTQLTPFVQQIAAGIRSGQSSSHVIMPMFSAIAPLVFLLGPSVGSMPNLGGMMCDQVTGSLTVFGSFNAYTNL